MAWDAGVNSTPVKVALQFNIKLIFYAEHGETEYGWKVLNEESKRKAKELDSKRENLTNQLDIIERKKEELEKVHTRQVKALETISKT